jgi:ribonuclease-3
MTRRPTTGIAELEAAIGHAFADRGLIGRALTHVSAISDNEARLTSYQRLEFLGDRVLGLAVADLLFRRFPGADEGELSRRLAGLVRKETCAEVAREWNIGPHLRLGPGEAQSGGRRKEAILGDVAEAIIGAVFVDAGFEAARALVERGFGSRLDTPARRLRDAKTGLQEWAQAKGLPTPTYEITAREGPDHAPRFTVQALVEGLAPAEGEGGSRRAAEMAAAETMLRREGAWRDGDEA